MGRRTIAAVCTAFLFGCAVASAQDPLIVGRPVDRAITAGRGQIDGRFRPGERLLEPAPPLLEGEGAEVLVADREQIEGDERRRCLLGQLPDP